MDCRAGEAWARRPNRGRWNGGSWHIPGITVARWCDRRRSFDVQQLGTPTRQPITRSSIRRLCSRCISWHSASVVNLADQLSISESRICQQTSTQRSVEHATVASHSTDHIGSHHPTIRAPEEPLTGRRGGVAVPNGPRLEYTTPHDDTLRSVAVRYCFPAALGSSRRRLSCPRGPGSPR